MSDAETDRQMAALTAAIFKAIGEHPELSEEDVYDVLLGVQETYSGDVLGDGEYSPEGEGADYVDYQDDDDRIDRGGDPNDPGGEA